MTPVPSSGDDRNSDLRQGSVYAISVHFCCSNPPLGYSERENSRLVYRLRLVYS